MSGRDPVRPTVASGVGNPSRAPMRELRCRGAAGLHRHARGRFCPRPSGWNGTGSSCC